MALLRYAVAGVLRNRRRTFSSILGVLLAITFIAGTFIAIDSSTRSTLDAILATAQGDFTYNAGGSSGGTVNGSQVRDALAAVPGVTDVSLYRYLPVGLVFLGEPGDRNYSSAGIIAIDPVHLPWALRQMSVNGSLQLPQGSTAISAETARMLKTGLDGVVRVTNYGSDPFGNMVPVAQLNFTVSAILTPTAPPIGYYGGTYGDYPLGTGTLIVNLADANWVEANLNVSDPYPSVTGEIWINRDRFINVYDPDSTNFNLLRLERILNHVVEPFGGYVFDNLGPRLASFESIFASERVQFLLLSIPVILLGLYLGAVGVDLGHAERRRELAVLKTRGAGRRQILGLLILEAFLGGLLAMIIGLVAGIGLSRFLLTVVNPIGAAYVPRYGDIFLSPDSVITIGVLSILFMGAVSYRSAKRTSGLPIVESLRYYAPGETRIVYNPWWDIVEVGYGAAAYVLAFYIRWNTGGFWTFVFGIILLASLPLVPIFLTVGATRLITRTTGKVYEWTARAFRPVAKNLEYVISRNLSRNPRRASNIAVIIALGLAFGVFTVSLLGSQQAYQERALRANVGADMAVWPGFRANKTFGTKLQAIPGVSGVTEVISVVAQPALGYETPYTSLFAVDPSSYFAVVKPESFYFDTPSADRVPAVLAEKGSVLLSRAFAVAAALQVGDRFSITKLFYSNGTQRLVEINVSVAGIVRTLPGTTYGGYPIGGPGIIQISQFYPGDQAIFGSFNTLEPLWTTIGLVEQNDSSSKYLVALAPGADWRAVKSAIADLGGGATVYQEELEAINNSGLTSSFLGFVKLEIAFMVVILTAGLGLIIYAASLERDVEFAAIIARGSSGWQTAGLLVGEAFSIMIIGVLVGVAVGLATGFFYTEFLFVNPTGGTVEPAIPYFFIFPPEGWLLVAASAGAMLLAAVIVSWRIVRMDVARVLKVRGG